MSRRKFLKAGITAGAAAGTLGFPHIARAQKKFSWKMTSAYPKGAPFYMDGPGSATDLARRIEAMSGGRLRIQVYGAGELVPAFEGFDAVRSGTEFHERVFDTQRAAGFVGFSAPRDGQDVLGGQRGLQLGEPGVGTQRRRLRPGRGGVRCRRFRRKVGANDGRQRLPWARGKYA